MSAPIRSFETSLKPDTGPAGKAGWTAVVKKVEEPVVGAAVLVESL
jgi:hypothetical protein